VTFQPEAPLSGYLASSSTVTPQKRSPRLALMAVIGLLVVGAGMFLYARKRPQALGGPNSNSVGAAQAVVTIRVEPASATIYFDDAPLSGNPASVTFSRDGLAHRVRAEAPGYARKTELAVLDSSNVNVEIGLEPESKDEVDPFGNKLTALTVKATPPATHIFLDNVLLPTNPATGKYVRDGKQHAVRCEAAGFVTKTQSVAFDLSAASVSCSLDKEGKASLAAVTHGKGAGKEPKDPGPTTVTAAPAAPTPPPTPTPTPAPAKTGKSLDRSDPWAN
jgi:hypothetical protein